MTRLAASLTPLLLGVLVGAGVIWPLNAGAQPSRECRNFDKQIRSGEGVHHDLHTGVRSDVTFASASDDCVRVSTIGVINANETGYVEWGWVLGYSGIPCGDNYYSSPTLFLAWKNPGGGDRCTVHFGNASGSFVLQASDLNQNTYWDFFKSGTNIDQANMDFHRGTNFLLTERTNANDPGYGNFDSLRKSLTSGSSFQVFTSPGVQADLDDGYKFCKVSDTHVKHIANASSCP